MYVCVCVCKGRQDTLCSGGGGERRERKYDDRELKRESGGSTKMHQIELFLNASFFSFFLSVSKVCVCDS